MSQCIFIRQCGEQCSRSTVSGWYPHLCHQHRKKAARNGLLPVAAFPRYRRGKDPQHDAQMDAHWRLVEANINRRFPSARSMTP